MDMDLLQIFLLKNMLFESMPVNMKWDYLSLKTPESLHGLGD